MSVHKSIVAQILSVLGCRDVTASKTYVKDQYVGLIFRFWLDGEYQPRAVYRNTVVHRTRPVVIRPEKLFKFTDRLLVNDAMFGPLFDLVLANGLLLIL